jgi:hypothetical protein
MLFIGDFSDPARADGEAIAAFNEIATQIIS